jgi:IclR helix-turn-helix domain
MDIKYVAIDAHGVLFEYRTNVQIKIGLLMADVNMTDEAGAGRLPEGMGGLAKGLAIIEAFSPHRTRMTLSEAAQSSGTSRASARRCLLTLAELGYLEFDGKYFRPQPRLLALSAAYSVRAHSRSLHSRSLKPRATSFMNRSR